MSRLHVIDIRHAKDRPNYATCSCGWCGSALTLSQAVAAEGRAHARDATRADVERRRDLQSRRFAQFDAQRAQGSDSDSDSDSDEGRENDRANERSNEKAS